MSLKSRFTQTPTAGLIAAQLIPGAALVALALLIGLDVSTPGGSVRAVALGAVAGGLVGQGLGMLRHRMAAQARGLLPADNQRHP